MKIACPHCRAAFALDDKRVPPAGLSIKCPKCKQPFAVNLPRAGEEGKVVEGRALAVPLPGSPRASSPGLPAATTRAPDGGAPKFGSVSPRPRAVPLPGADGSRGPVPVVTKPTSVPAMPSAAASFDSGQPADSLVVPLPGGASRPPPARTAALEHDPFAGIDLDVPDEASPSAPAPGMELSAPAPARSSGALASSLFSDPFGDLPAAPSGRPTAGPFVAAARDDATLDDLFAMPAPAAESTPSAPVFAPPLEASAPAVSDAPSAVAAPATPALADGEDPFGLDLPVSSAPVQSAAAAPTSSTPAAPALSSPEEAFGLDFDFVAPPAAAAAALPETKAAAPVSAPPPPARPARVPPVMARAEAPAAAAPRAGLDANAETSEEPLFAPPAPSISRPPPAAAPEPKEPLGARAKEALKPVAEVLASLRHRPKLIVSTLVILALLSVVGLGVHARSSSAGLFWMNLWTPSGKQHSAAAHEALTHGEEQLNEGSFGVAREAMGTAARTLATLPDDEEARSFFVLAASELKIGWGAGGGDWDQAAHLANQLDAKQATAARAQGAYALAANDLARAKLLLAPLGDAPNANPEAVWLYAQALWRSNEAAHAAQVLDNALKTHASVKLLLLRGLIESARGKPEAGKFFEQALATAPTAGRVLLESADVKLKAGELEAASALLDRALTPDVRHQLDATEEGRASLLRARLFVLQHQAKEAEAQFDRAVILDVNSAEIHVAYALFRLQRREYDKAAKQFDAAFAIGGQSPDTLASAALAYLGASRYLDADKRVRDGLSKDANNARLHFVAGKVAESIGKADEANKEYERALSIKADLPAALIAVAQAALVAGDIDKARDRATKAEKADVADKSALDLEGLAELWLSLHEPEKAKTSAAAAHAIEPEDPYAQFVLGRAQAAVGDLPAARALYEQALARIDSDPAMHYELGSLLRRLHDLPAARKELEKAVALDAKPSNLQSRLGAVLVEQGEAAAAEPHLRQAILSNDHNAEALYFLGRALLLGKKLSEAIDVLKRAIEADPSDAQYDFHLGLAYEGGAQLSDATAAFTQATKKDPKSAEAWEHLGLALVAQNAFDDALEAYRKAVALEPTRARFWAEIGDAQQQSNDPDAAIESFQKSVKLDITQAAVWTKLGQAFRDKGCATCKAHAIESLVRATQLAPSDPTAFHELGYVYKDDRKRHEAIAAFKRYIELKPDASDAESVKDDIFYLQEEGKRTP